MRADSVITNDAGGKCLWKRFIEKLTKRVKRLDLSNIKEYLRVRYAMAEEVTAKSLSAAQIAQLYSDILKKDRHKKLYNVRENEQASVV
ncbi:hypothetical protein PAEPH01_2878, partial [Pancytospora epiphaga]